MINDIEKLDKAIWKIVEIYNEIEAGLIDNVARVFANGKNIQGASEWQVSKMMQFEIVRKKNELLMNEKISTAFEEIIALLDDVGYSILNESESDLFEAYNKGKLPTYIPIEESENLQNVLKYWQQQTIEYLNVANNQMIGSANSELRKIVAQATLSTVSGVESRQEAVRKAIKKFAEDGVSALVDRSGRNWSPEAYVNMKIRTNSSDLTNEMVLARNEDYGNDLVEVSSHANSRPSHAKWQGRIYSLSGNSKKYPNFYKVTKYGQKTEDALGSWNCNHTFYPYIQGVSKKTYNPYPVKETNEKYEETQKQRYLERDIRKKKRVLMAMEDINDTIGIKEAKESLRLANANMKAFIEETDRKRRRDREQI